MGFNHRDQSIHARGINDEGHVEAIDDNSGFHDEIDARLGWADNKQESVSWDDMSAAFSMVLEYLTKSAWDKPADLKMVGARCESLLWLLGNGQSKYASLAHIAEEAGCTRAALSSQMLSLKDQIGLAISGGKPEYHRDSCRRAQLAAKAAGIHSSFHRRGAD